MISIETLDNIYVYAIGACVLSVVVAVIGLIATYLSLKVIQTIKLL